MCKIAGDEILEMRYMNMLGLIGRWWESKVFRRRVHRPQAVARSSCILPGHSVRDT